MAEQSCSDGVARKQRAVTDRKELGQETPFKDMLSSMTCFLQPGLTSPLSPSVNNAVKPQTHLQTDESTDEIRASGHHLLRDPHLQPTRTAHEPRWDISYFNVTDVMCLLIVCLGTTRRGLTSFKRYNYYFHVYACLCGYMHV